jgi:hypothetical protein
MTTLDKLELYAEFSSAAYCNLNIANLPRGQANKTFVCSVAICKTISAPRAVAPTIVLSGHMVPMVFNTNGTDYPPYFYVAVDTARSQIVVAFEGTVPSIDIRDAQSRGQLDQDIGSMTGGEALGGSCIDCYAAAAFLSSWRLNSTAIVTVINNQLKVMGQEKYRVVFTGHSLGGALATVAAADVRAHSSIANASGIDLVRPSLSFFNYRTRRNHCLLIQDSMRMPLRPLETIIWPSSLPAALHPLPSPTTVSRITTTMSPTPFQALSRILQTGRTYLASTPITLAPNTILKLSEAIPSLLATSTPFRSTSQTIP